VKNNENAATHSATEKDELRNLALDLREAYTLLNGLSIQLEGGGIVRARDVEPAVAKAVPKLRHAVAVLNAVTTVDQSGLKPN